MLIMQDESHRTTWKVGEALFIPEGRVVTFRADGEELEIIVAGLLRTVSGDDRGLDYD